MTDTDLKEKLKKNTQVTHTIIKVNLALILLFVIIFDNNFLEANCLICHKDIEKISNIEEMNELTCDFCHKGNPNSKNKKIAHKGMWANPSDLRVVDKTCGLCHKDIVNRVKKSLHSTSAGIISATRYLFGAQKTKNALYANYEIKDKNTFLKSLPSYNPLNSEGPENSPADDYLRHECLRCHLYSYGEERYGDYRASGCAACHVLYDDDGRYKGNDKAILKYSPKARPKIHFITTLIPPSQCIHCHNRGGRTGVSFIGTIESDGYGSPWSCEAGKKGGIKIHGKYYNYLSPDIHYTKGLYCIDCHTEKDLHGDGKIYSKKEQAVEIECQDCHGTIKSKSNLKSSKGTLMKNLKKENNNILLVSKNGKKFIIPQVIDILNGNNIKAKKAMKIKRHMERLECYACHAKWAPQCYGCHAQQNLSKRAYDWLDAKDISDISQKGKAKNRKKIGFKWLETRSYIRWEDPTLGINSEGKVSPFIPGCQVIFTQIGPDGKCKIHNKIFKMPDGTYAIATNPIQPHTISKHARSCTDCHRNPKAVGLGLDIYDTKANGVDFPYSLEQIVTKDGKQIQATSHDGARPFSKEELKKILTIDIYKNF